MIAEGTADEGLPRPVFVVGAPRSGTSILTWCLGQHSNLLPLEESAWMGDFAVDVAVRHAQGSNRGARSQLSAMGVTREAFFAPFGAAIDRLVLQHRSRFEALNLAVAAREAVPCDGAFQLARAPDDRKSRWVNGTPEYSLHIAGLHALFPAARFVHIVRDVGDVAASMLHIRRITDTDLVATAEHAYAYWWRTVDACLAAEHALGADIVWRLRYSDLIERPQPTLRALLAFLGEDYQTACAEPLRQRINSSQVAPEYRIDVAHIDPALHARAQALSQLLQTAPAPYQADPARRSAFARGFDERAVFVAGLDAEHQLAQSVVEQLNRELRERNRWAHALDRELDAARQSAAQLNGDIEERNAWAHRLERELAEKSASERRLRQRSNGYAVVLALQLLIGAILLATPDAVGAVAYPWLLGGFMLTSLAALTFAWSRRQGLQRLCLRCFARLLPH